MCRLFKRVENNVWRKTFFSLFWGCSLFGWRLALVHSTNRRSISYGKFYGGFGEEEWEPCFKFVLREPQRLSEAQTPLC